MKQGNMVTLKDYEKFLQSIDLDKYRYRYLDIKIVEMDLPKQVQALDIIYKVYWDDKKYLNYDKFYKKYLKEYGSELELFRKKIRMCKNCFHLGLPARIYRTWASLITQIQAGYLAETVFGVSTVSMSSELDRNGADFQVLYKNAILNFQVKKESMS